MKQLTLNKDTLKISNSRRPRYCYVLLLITFLLVFCFGIAYFSLEAIDKPVRLRPAEAATYFLGLVSAWSLILALHFWLACPLGTWEIDTVGVSFKAKSMPPFQKHLAWKAADRVRIVNDRLFFFERSPRFTAIRIPSMDLSNLTESEFLILNQHLTRAVPTEILGKEPGDIFPLDIGTRAYYFWLAKLALISVLIFLALLLLTGQLKACGEFDRCAPHFLHLVPL